MRFKSLEKNVDIINLKLMKCKQLAPGNLFFYCRNLDTSLPNSSNFMENNSPKLNSNYFT